MRTFITLVLFSITTLFIQAKDDLKKNFVIGNPGIQSINALSFGPEGILFIGDSKNAMVYAIDTKDVEKIEKAEAISMNKVDEKIADVLGTSADKIAIQDMAVNPLSKKVYFAIHHEDGTPVLLTLSGDSFEWMSLDNVSHSKKEINDALAPDAEDKRGRSLRVWTVSDLTYHAGKVMVSGLSNKEFGSTFRSMPFPFEDTEEDATLEIYHAAHGKYETHAPIKAFTVGMVNGKEHLVAGYTCTPLVVFPVEKLSSGEHVKGRTVAELGNWNTPLDMIVMEKEGNAYLLMANSNRSFMKIKFSDIERFEGSLTDPIQERSGTAGVDFISLPWVNVLQLAKLDDQQFVMLKRQANGDLDLLTQGERWL